MGALEVSDAVCRRSQFRVTPPGHAQAVGLFRRQLPPVPQPPGVIQYERREIDWTLRSGWDPLLQRVRLSLPNHLHDSPPYRNGCRGLWTVIATVDQIPVGVAWSIEWVVDRTVALIEETAVVPTWRRRGIGRRLITESADWMAVEGYRSLAALPITEESHLLFDGLGFVDDAFGTKRVEIATLIDT